MRISSLSWNKVYYTLEVSKAGGLQLKTRTLNIVERALRALFKSYNSTIWTQKKLNRYVNRFPTQTDKIIDFVNKLGKRGKALVAPSTPKASVVVPPVTPVVVGPTNLPLEYSPIILSKDFKTLQHAISVIGKLGTINPGYLYPAPQIRYHAAQGLLNGNWKGFIDFVCSSTSFEDEIISFIEDVVASGIIQPKLNDLEGKLRLDSGKWDTPIYEIIGELSRGITEVFMDDFVENDVDHLAQFPRLKKVVIWKTPASLSDLEKFNIESLYLHEIPKDFSGESLKAFPNLTSLELSSGVMSPDLLSNIKGLRSLKLCFIRTPEDLYATIGKMTELEELSITQMSITDDDLSQLLSLPHLKVLNIQGSLNQIDHELSKLCQLTKLEKLNVCNCKNVGFETIDHILKYVPLKELDIKHTRVGTKQVKKLMKLYPNVNIKHL